jgi:hypothetical protein
MVTFFRKYLRGKYHCTVDLLFDWFGLVCFTNKNNNSVVIQLIPNQSNRRSTVSDTSPFSIPCFLYVMIPYHSCITKPLIAIAIHALGSEIN